MKNENGITLVSLVITIIVMLILAAVSLSMVINGGIIDKAGDAVKQTELAEAKEDIAVRLIGVQAENKGRYSKADVFQIAKEVTGNDPVEDVTTGIVIVKTENGNDIDITEFVEKATAREPDVSLITFSVYGKEFKAEAGMTWLDWRDSEYFENFDEKGATWRIEDDGLLLIHPSGILLYNTNTGGEVSATNKIVENKVYWLNMVAEPGAYWQ